MENDKIKVEFQKFKNSEAELQWKTLKEKLVKKKEHLEKKYQGKTEIVDTIKGIKVSDKALGEKKHFPEPMILNVNKDTFSSNIQEVLKLHPKHALPVPVKLSEVKTEIQKGFYKQRLSMKREEERIADGETEEEAEKNDAKAHELFDKASNTINFNNLRPLTDPV